MLIKNTIIYGLGSLLINGFNFLLIPLYTSFLSPEEYGTLSITNIFTLLVSTFLGLGLQAAATRYYFDFKEKSDLDSYLFSLGLGVISIGLILSIILSIIGYYFFDNIFTSVKFYPYLLICIWIGFFNIIGIFCLAIFQARSEALRYRIFTTMNFLLLNVFMISFVVFLKWNIKGVLLAQFMGSSIMGVIYLFFFFRLINIGNFDYKHIKASLIFGIPLMLYAVLGYGLDFSSRYFIEKFTNLSSLGVFNLALQYSSVINILISSINMAWIPIFYEKALKTENRILFADFGLNYLSVISTIALCLSLFSREIVTSMTPIAYHESINLIPIMVTAYMIGNGIWILLVNPISFLKKNHLLLIVNGLTVILSILLNIILIPAYGVTGAVLSIFLSYIFLITITFISIDKKFSIPYQYQKIVQVLLLTFFFQAIGYFLHELVFYQQIIIKLGLIFIFLLTIKKIGLNLLSIKSILSK